MPTKLPFVVKAAICQSFKLVASNCSAQWQNRHELLFVSLSDSYRSFELLCSVTKPKNFILQSYNNNSCYWPIQWLKLNLGRSWRDLLKFQLNYFKIYKWNEKVYSVTGMKREQLQPKTFNFRSCLNNIIGRYLI